MIQIVVVVLAVFLVIFFSIKEWQQLDGKSKKNLTKTVVRNILVAALAMTVTVGVLISIYNIF